MAKGTCTVPGCTKQAKARGWCGMHHERQRRHGSLEHPTPSPEVRFWAKVNMTETCWLWTGSLTPHGYGSVHWEGRLQPAHRISYELLIGPIPDGLQIDHLCRVRRCVRPSDLEPVTRQENIRRGAALRNRCPEGHPYDMIDGGTRRCYRCRRAQARRNYRERKVRSQPG